MNQSLRTLILGAALGALCAGPAAAQDTIRIGMITTLSTGAGYLGEDVRDGFLLAVAEQDGRLGGTKVEVLVEDDGRDPATGRQLAERFIERDEVEIITGLIFSNISPVVVPLTQDAGIFYISPNSAPSIFAGENCHEDYFATAWQNDNLHESAGLFADELGYGNAYILAPNYQAGRDALAGFKRYFKGEIVGEVYTTLGQTDYAAEIADIRAAGPQMVFEFLPGGMGINFIKQYAQAGLAEQFPLVVSSASMDGRILSAVGDDALGIYSSAHWNHDLDSDANRAFIAGFEEHYGRAPTIWAAQGYDTALLIASALEATGGLVLADKDGFRDALRRAEFDAVRGSFRFNNNHHPINDWHGRVVERGEDGNLTITTLSLIAEAHEDAYASDCALDW